VEAAAAAARQAGAVAALEAEPRDEEASGEESAVPQWEAAEEPSDAAAAPWDAAAEVAALGLRLAELPPGVMYHNTRKTCFLAGMICGTSDT